MYFDADGNGSYSSTSIELSREKREIPKVHAPVDDKSQGNRVFRAIPPFCWTILPQSTVESPLPMQDTQLLLSFC
jgi:hypothetical protein